jgi:glycerol-3-phosphate dehydrogenase (NAD(P)+)
VVAAGSENLARSIQERISSSGFRLYWNTDPVGVQVAGALKNVIAIAAGAVDGLELGLNTRAAVITRGLAEITRLGRSLGGRMETFSGLAGLGDLVLTCTGASSRNRAVGVELGRGRRLADILSGTRAVAEGVATARSARDLAARSGVDAPIVEEVCRILFEGGSPLDALERLMARPLTAELSSPGEETIHG